MDAPEFDNVEAEKARAMRRYKRLRIAGKLFRLFEICAALMFLSWTFTRLPFAVRISGQFFARAAGVVASPLFVFLISNVIIATLIAKSSGPSGVGKTSDDNVNSELYDKIIKNSENRVKSFQCYEGDDDQLSADEIVYQDKEIICEESAIPPPKIQEMEAILETDAEMVRDLELDCSKIYRRTKSEKFPGEIGEEKAVKKELRRSEMERAVKKELRRSETERLCSEEEEMGNEEFQRMIEEFIAKQLRFRREETLSIVPSNPGLNF